MRSLVIIFGLCAAVTAIAAPNYDPADADTVQDISLALVDENGQLLRAFPIPAGRESTRDVLFQATIEPRYAGYQAAIVEISDPTHGAKTRLQLDGELPQYIHWNGVFSGRLAIEKGRRYFMRVVLFYADGSAMSSPWAFFVTRLRTAYDDARKVKANYISLYISPTGGMHMASLFTQSFKRVLYPNVYGDVALVWMSQHSLILKLEATSNILFGYGATATNFAYSDVSLSYRYRLAGAPLRAPVLPADPPFGNYKYRLPAGRSDTYGKPFNLETGMRVFYTTLRGDGMQPMDRETARRFSGATLVLDGNQTLGDVRLHFSAELGYSAFLGQITVAGVGSALTYERFESVAPGLELRYHHFTGTPAADPFTGLAAPVKVTNHLLLAGLTLKFKL